MAGHRGDRVVAAFDLHPYAVAGGRGRAVVVHRAGRGHDCPGIDSTGRGEQVGHTDIVTGDNRVVDLEAVKSQIPRKSLYTRSRR